MKVRAARAHGNSLAFIRLPFHQWRVGNCTPELMKSRPFFPDLHDLYPDPQSTTTTAITPPPLADAVVHPPCFR